jgi:hypothetical protein
MRKCFVCIRENPLLARSIDRLFIHWL